MEQYGFVGGHEPQLAQQPEAVGEQAHGGDQDGARNHEWDSLAAEDGMPSKREGGRESARGPTPLTRAVCGRGRGWWDRLRRLPRGVLRWKGRVARGSGTGLSRRTPATPFSPCCGVLI